MAAQVFTLIACSVVLVLDTLFFSQIEWMICFVCVSTLQLHHQAKESLEKFRLLFVVQICTQLINVPISFAKFLSSSFIYIRSLGDYHKVSRFLLCE
ncbi:putative membrane protein [Bartonella silvatica]|uniref:Membrane protein n=1 Tax=Bartonella silvatica TaxID=357760 RepID=A0ABV2HGC6_9HYPH